MKFRSLSGSLQTSVIGFGGSSISGSAGGYGFGPMSDAESAALLEHAFRKGITLFDTAPCYGLGTSEQRIGAALTGHASLRKDIVVVSKAGVTWDEQGNTRVDNAPDVVRRMLDQSLKDLRTDYIDLYMIHWPDPATPVEETMRALKPYRDAGTIRAIGACNFSPELWRRASAVAPVEVLQSEFHAFNEENGSNLFPLCREKRLGFMSYGTLAKGILTGKVKAGRTYDAADFRGQHAFVGRQAALLEAEALRFLEIARELSVTPASLAVAYVLSFEEVSTALCGARTPEQVDTLMAGAELAIPGPILEELRGMACRATPLFLKGYENS